MILTRYGADNPPAWANDPIEKEPPIRLLRRPRTPPMLAECGWYLARLPGGHWWCVHAGAELETHIYTAPGPAIEEATQVAEPDHERVGKREREWYLLTRKLGWRRHA